MSGTQDAPKKKPSDDLEKLETRLPRRTMKEFRLLAKKNRRSAAAELRVAAERHLEQAA